MLSPSRMASQSKLSSSPPRSFLGLEGVEGVVGVVHTVPSRLALSAFELLELGVSSAPSGSSSSIINGLSAHH
jgi:hypothetical protein